jgi:hypothetical protein
VGTKRKKAREGAHDESTRPKKKRRKSDLLSSKRETKAVFKSQFLSI